jgi:hypothetical protein
MAGIDSLTDEQLEQVALGNVTLDEALNKKPYYTADNIDELSDEQLAMVAAGTPLSEIQKERNEFVGMGSSIAGALGGAAIGTAVLPGLGTVAGGIIGGALGAFGGELAEDQLQGEDLDFVNATKEAGLSVGIDLVTLGVGSKVKTAFLAAKRAMGFSPTQAADEIIEHLSSSSRAVGEVGSAAEAAAANRLLQEGGGGLTAAQLPTASAFTRFADNLGRIGFTSQQDFVEHHAKNNQAVVNTVEELLDSAGATSMSAPSLGESILEVLKLGKKNSTALYGKELSKVQEMLATDVIDVASIFGVTNKILKDNSRNIMDTALEAEATTVLKGMTDELQRLMPKPTGRVDIVGKPIYSKGKSVPAYELIEWEKKWNGTIAKMLDAKGGLYAPKAHQQLVEVFNKITPVIKNTLEKVNPKAASRYKRLNSVYARTRDMLSPKAVKTLIGKAADKEEFNQLGKVFLPDSGVDPDKAKQLWNSINFAVKRLSKEEVAEKGFTNADDILKSIKASFIDRVLPNYKSDDFDMITIAKKVANMKPETLDVAKKVFTPEEYSRFSAMRGAIRMASKAKSSDMFSLAFRSREISSVGSVAGAVGIGGLGGYSAGIDPVTGGLGGLAFLLTPKVLAKIALSPNRTKKFIKLMSTTSSTPEGLSQTQKQGSLLLAELIDSYGDLEQ